MEHYKIQLNDLPKVSTNEIYAGINWKKRKGIKDVCKLIVKNQYKNVFKANKSYHVEYVFVWKNNPLDAMNCTFLAKIIEDIIFENDKHDIIIHFGISSRKGKKDTIYIDVMEI